MLFFNNAVALPEQSYTYDALYRLVIATGREKIGPATFGVLDNYNDSPWMAGITWKADDNGCQNYTENYNYDEVGNIMTLQHSGAASGSSYTRIYNYDSASNKLLSTTVGTTTYSNAYDRRGNIVQMPHLSSITFNAANEMSSCNLGGGGNVYYQYSGGQRGRKTVINGSLTTQRIYIGNHEIYRSYTGSTLNVERRTVHVADDTGRIAMYEYVSGGGDSYAPVLSRYIYSNHLSTATLELDNNASIISYEEYHPYGTTAFQEMNAAINATAKRYRYVGKERDEESGFYYMGARYYAPWLGRWCACDPINSEIYNYNKGNPKRNIKRDYMELTASSYEYCYANPLRFTDQFGEQATPQQINAVGTYGVTPTSQPSKQQQPVNIPNFGEPNLNMTPSQDKLKPSPRLNPANQGQGNHSTNHKQTSSHSGGSSGDEGEGSKHPGTQKIGMVILGEGGGDNSKLPSLAHHGISLGSFDFKAFNDILGLVSLASPEMTKEASGPEMVNKVKDYISDTKELNENKRNNTASITEHIKKYNDTSEIQFTGKASFTFDTGSFMTGGYNPHIEKTTSIQLHYENSFGERLDTNGINKIINDSISKRKNDPVYKKYSKNLQN